MQAGGCILAKVTVSIIFLQDSGTRIPIREMLIVNCNVIQKLV